MSEVDWDYLYTASRRYFNMTRDEFLFEHDLVGISEMLNQIVKHENQRYEENTYDNSPEEMPAVDFL